MSSLSHILCSGNWGLWGVQPGAVEEGAPSRLHPRSWIPWADIAQPVWIPPIPRAPFRGFPHCCSFSHTDVISPFWFPGQSLLLSYSTFLFSPHTCLGVSLSEGLYLLLSLTYPVCFSRCGSDMHIPCLSQWVSDFPRAETCLTLFFVSVSGM